MNKRIEELAKQSGFEEDGGHLLIHGVYVTNRLEKFAKAIVKECAQIAFEGDLKRPWGQWGSDVDMLKHFEVEHDTVAEWRKKNEERNNT